MRKKLIVMLLAFVCCVTLVFGNAACKDNDADKSDNNNSNVETDGGGTNNDDEENDNNLDNDNKDDGNTVSVVGTYREYITEQNGEIIDVATSIDEITFYEDGTAEIKEASGVEVITIAWLLWAQKGNEITIRYDLDALKEMFGDDDIDLEEVPEMKATIVGDCLLWHDPNDEQHIIIFKKVLDTPITPEDVAGLYEYYADKVSGIMQKTSNSYIDILLYADGTGMYNYGTYNFDFTWTMNENIITVTFKSINPDLFELFKWVNGEYSSNGEFIYGEFLLNGEFIYSNPFIYKKLSGYTTIDKGSVVGTYDYYATKTDSLQFEDSESYLILDSDGTGEYKALVQRQVSVFEYQTEYRTFYIQDWEVIGNKIEIYAIDVVTGWRPAHIKLRIDGDYLHVCYSSSYFTLFNTGYIYLKVD